MIRFTVLTKLETLGTGAGAAGNSSGAGATGSVGGGGKGVPTATGAGGELGEISTDGITGGTTGGILKLMATATSETMAKNRTPRRILNFPVPMTQFGTQLSFQTALPQCAGINRQVAVNERVIR
jgi:hypothetical protein